jgi:hypothetical protein
MSTALLLLAAVVFPPPRPPSNDITVANRVPIRMRDGVVLYADVYRPVGDGQYPVLVSRTPYSTERAPSAYAPAVFFARRGYVFVFQDVRGRHESEGGWNPFLQEQQDGYDTIEWAARQPWSNGKVGMQGASYLGHVQWQAAMARPPSLAAVFPNLAPTSIYHDTVTLNGAFRLSLAFGWGPVRQESRIMQNTGMHTMPDGPDGLSFEKILWHLPLSEMPKLAGRRAAFWDDWLRHPEYDDFWRAASAEEVFDRIQIPVHTFGGWFDILIQGTLRGYQGVKGQRRMVVGPWGHGPSRKYGEVDFGEEAHVDPQAVELRWFDYTLKGLKNGLEREPPVKIFTMGVNRWRGESRYPLERTEYRKLYFHSEGKPNSYRGDGRLSWEPPSGDPSPARYRHDPDYPVPSIGGNNCCGAPTPAGPVDQRPVEDRNDVLVYTSDYLDQPLDVTGPVQVVLHAASDAGSADFVAKLVDVYPDGKAYNMAEGVYRARRLERGKAQELTIDLVGTSVVFQPGHRIRVSIASSHFPQFDRQPQAANQRVFATRAYASHIVLPVIPRGREELAAELTSIGLRQLGQRDRVVAQITTREALERRKQEVREKILRLIGGLPERRGPLNPKPVGVLERQGYRIEKVIFESLPGSTSRPTSMSQQGRGPSPRS